MLNYMIIFKECFRTARLIRFKVYSFMTPFLNTEVPGWGWGVTKVLFMKKRIMDSEYLICLHDNNSYSCIWDMY